MGDYRITVEGVGSHGCGRDDGDGAIVTRCGAKWCVDCAALALVEALGVGSVKLAKLEHWPVPGAAGTERTEHPGPVDDLLSGVRHGSFES